MIYFVTTERKDPLSYGLPEGSYPLLGHVTKARGSGRKCCEFRMCFKYACIHSIIVHAIYISAALMVSKYVLSYSYSSGTLPLTGPHTEDISTV